MDIIDIIHEEQELDRLLFEEEMREMTEWNVGQVVKWLTRPIPGGYLHGIVIKIGSRKIGIAVQSKTGEWKPKWAEPGNLRRDYEHSSNRP